MEKSPTISTVADILWLPMCALIGFGLLMIFSADYIRAGDIFCYFTKQLFWIIIGSGIFYAILKMNYKFLQKYSLHLLIIGILILSITLFSPEKGGAKRWLLVGQPSEFVRVLFFLYLSAFLSKKSGTCSLKKCIVSFIFFGAIIVILALQPHIGMILFIFCVIFGLLFISGIKKRWLLPIGVIMIIISSALIIAYPHSLERIENFSEKKEWQVEQSAIALGTGGLFGAGIGESRQKLRGFLPMPQTDFIFSILGEEMGFFGTLFIISCLLVFSACGFLIAFHSQSLSGSFLAFSLTLGITLGAIINLCVILGIVPTTGLPFPYISYGGSALVSNLMACGLILKVGYSEE
ncbi:MAG: FtsW/RodA/SpoVE family cell cycle protein [bacterium]|nr:FtsW/RodA/SpoVE family cell cycle protein [bacterium]